MIRYYCQVHDTIYALADIDVVDAVLYFTTTLLLLKVTAPSCWLLAGSEGSSRPVCRSLLTRISLSRSGRDLRRSSKVCQDITDKTGPQDSGIHCSIVILINVKFYI